MYIEVILDMTNRNALISTAMFNAICNGRNIDNIDFIRPFVIYVIGKRYNIDAIIDNSKVIEDIENKFGLIKVSSWVIDKILLRISKIDKALKEQRYSDGRKVYKVKRELLTLCDKISEKKDISTKKINELIESLKLFLIDKHWSKCEITNETVERFLINFLEEQGLETLRYTAIPLDENQINFFIGNYILHIQQEDEELFNNFLDITTGYMISKVIYFEVNNDGEVIDFSNVDFYIDTRLLLGMLKYKTDIYNENCDMLRRMVINKGGNLKCFSHNFRELESILEGYKNSLINPFDDKLHTLEFFDDNNVSVSDIDMVISLLEEKLNKINISVVDAPPYLKNEYEHVIDEQGLRECLVTNISYANKDGQSPDNDVKSISSIHRLRKNCICNKLVNCKAFFITDNSQLARVGNKFIRNSEITYKYGLTMESVDLATIIWLSCSSIDKDFPKKKLIENAMATQEISNNVRNEFLKCVDKMKVAGEFTDTEATILRRDRYMSNKVMELSNGDSKEVNETLILCAKKLYDDEIINEKYNEQLKSKDDDLKSKDVENERLRSQLEEKNRQLIELQKIQEDENNKRIIENNKKIDDDATQERNRVEKCWRIFIKLIITIIILLFLIPQIYDIITFMLDNNPKQYAVIILIKSLVGIISVIFTYITIRDKNNVIEKFIKAKGTKAYEQEIMKHCPSLLESALSKEKAKI